MGVFPVNVTKTCDGVVSYIAQWFFSRFGALNSLAFSKSEFPPPPSFQKYPRGYMVEPPSVHALPSWWAWLAPLGAGGLGLVTSTSLLGDETLVTIAFWLAALIWGFSAWWVIFALYVIWSNRKEAKFHLGYWGFGFLAHSLKARWSPSGRHCEQFLTFPT